MKFQSGNKLMTPPCERCIKDKAVCRRKVRGPGCERCSQRKAGCSAVPKKKEAKKVAEKGMEITSDEVPTPWVELSDNFMEQVELLVKNTTEIGSGVRGLVEEMKKMVRVVERLVGTDKVDKQTETEDQTEESEDEESEEEEDESVDGEKDEETEDKGEVGDRMETE